MPAGKSFAKIRIKSQFRIKFPKREICMIFFLWIFADSRFGFFVGIGFPPVRFRNLEFWKFQNKFRH